MGRRLDVLEVLLDPAGTRRSQRHLFGRLPKDAAVEVDDRGLGHRGAKIAADEDR